MTQKIKLVNNGFRETISRFDIHPGDVIEISWEDSDNELVVVLQPSDIVRPKSYKGWISLNILRRCGECCSVESDQVVRLTGRNVFGLIARHVK